MRNRGKNRQRRGLPPPCGIHPAVLDAPASSLLRPLGWLGSHRWCGTSTESTCFSGRQCFYRQGLTLVNRCPQRSAAGTPLLQDRPGHGNRPTIGPAARISWCGGTTRRHSKGDGPNLDLTQAQPRTPREVLRGERPKWLFVHFGHSKWTPAERPWKGAGFCPGTGAGQSLRPGLRRATSLYTREAFEVKKYGQPKLTVLFVVLELSDGSACAPPRQCSAAARWRPGWPHTPAA